MALDEGTDTSPDNITQAQEQTQVPEELQILINQENLASGEPIEDQETLDKTASPIADLAHIAVEQAQNLPIANIEESRQNLTRQDIIERFDYSVDVTKVLTAILVNTTKGVQIAEAQEALRENINKLNDPYIKQYDMTANERRRLFQLVGLRLERHANKGAYLVECNGLTIDEIRKNVARGKRESPDIAEQDILHALVKLFAYDLETDQNNPVVA
jgi:hypothetical protein